MDYGMQESQLRLHCCILKIYEFILCYNPLVSMFIVKKRLAFPAERICYQREGARGLRLSESVQSELWRELTCLKQSEASKCPFVLLKHLLASAQNQLRKESCFSGAWFFPTGTDFCYSPHSPEAPRLTNSSEDSYCRWL